ncbi:hypothetical protein RKD33_003578 [Streptomyces sp. SAI-129]
MAWIRIPRGTDELAIAYQAALHVAPLLLVLGPVPSRSLDPGPRIINC